MKKLTIINNLQLIIIKKIYINKKAYNKKKI